MEQIFSIRPLILLIVKYPQHHHDLYHNFIDSKKTFDRVWHEGLWQVMKQYNIGSNLIGVIEAL